MSKIGLEENKLIVKDGIFKSNTLALDDLRLVYLFLPESLKSWFVVTSSSGIEGYNLDSVTDDKIHELSQNFDEMIRREKGYKLSAIKLCLANYENRAALVSLKEFKGSKIDIFSQLLRYRTERIGKRKQWLKGNPEVVLKGVMGQQAVVNARGFRRGKKMIAWEDVGTMQINTVNFSTNLLVIPKGVSSGYFSFKKHQYSFGISLKKKELYIAECDFWMSEPALAGDKDIPGQIEELAQLRDQGVLAEEKFQEAKKALLAKI
jgi:hypothetical protein